MSMEGTTAERHDTESQERPTGQAWVIVIRARRGSGNAGNSLIYVVCVRDTQSKQIALTDKSTDLAGGAVSGTGA